MKASRGSSAGCRAPARPARRRKAASSSSASAASGGRSIALPPSSAAFTASTSATAAGAPPLAPSAAACRRTAAHSRMAWGTVGSLNKHTQPANQEQMSMLCLFACSASQPADPWTGESHDLPSIEQNLTEPSLRCSGAEARAAAARHCGAHQFGQAGEEGGPELHLCPLLRPQRHRRAVQRRQRRAAHRRLRPAVQVSARVWGTPRQSNLARTRSQVLRMRRCSHTECGPACKAQGSTATLGHAPGLTPAWGPGTHPACRRPGLCALQPAPRRSAAAARPRARAACAPPCAAARAPTARAAGAAPARAARPQSGRATWAARRAVQLKGRPLMHTKLTCNCLMQVSCDSL